jgi:hypothetical protein
MAWTKPPSSSAGPSTKDAASEVGEVAVPSFEVDASLDGDGLEAPSTTGFVEPSFELASTAGAGDVVQPTAPSKNAVERTMREGLRMVMKSALGMPRALAKIGRIVPAL